MVTRLVYASTASTLQNIPLATSFHLGFAGSGARGETGSEPDSSEIFCERRFQRDVGGRRTSVGHERRTRSKRFSRASRLAMARILDVDSVTRPLEEIPRLGRRQAQEKAENHPILQTARRRSAASASGEL
jgi:hypothetical protein